MIRFYVRISVVSSMKLLLIVIINIESYTLNHLLDFVTVITVYYSTDVEMVWGTKWPAG